MTYRLHVGRCEDVLKTLPVISRYVVLKSFSR